MNSVAISGNIGKSWDGWKNLRRTWDAIKMKASYLGVRKRHRKG